jgi:hypothetical protein
VNLEDVRDSLLREWAETPRELRIDRPLWVEFSEMRKSEQKQGQAHLFFGGFRCSYFAA